MTTTGVQIAQLGVAFDNCHANSPTFTTCSGYAIQPLSTTQNQPSTILGKALAQAGPVQAQHKHSEKTRMQTPAVCATTEHCQLQRYEQFVKLRGDAYTPKHHSWQDNTVNLKACLRLLLHAGYETVLQVERQEHHSASPSSITPHPCRDQPVPPPCCPLATATPAVAAAARGPQPTGWAAADTQRL